MVFHTDEQEVALGEYRLLVGSPRLSWLML